MNYNELWKQVKENSKTLEACPGHNFSIDVTPEKPIGKRWKCENCGGEVDSPAKAWYEKGRKHERAKEVEQNARG